MKGRDIVRLSATALLMLAASSVRADVSVVSSSADGSLRREVDRNVVAVGPLTGGRSLVRGRVLPRDNRTLARLSRRLIEPGVFVPWVRVDVDGDGRVDLERGFQLCDGDNDLRTPFSSTRNRVAGGWRTIDVEYHLRPSCAARTTGNRATTS